MKFTSAILLFILLFSCRKENSIDQLPQGSTDTSVIFTKKTIYYNSLVDSSIMVYKNNKLNGVKGYIIIDSRPSQNYTYASIFNYNNSGRLTEIVSSENTPKPHVAGTFRLTWEGNKIKRIKWDEDGTYGVDRTYDYATLNDTLLIRYNFNIGRDLYLDSSSVTVFTDTGLNKVYRIFKEGEFDFTGIFSKAKGALYNERKFQYDGNNIQSVKYYGETYYSTNPDLFLYEVDSSVCYFTRESRVNSFLSDVEKNIFGKELRILCYDQTDAIGYILENYFNYGSFFSVSALRDGLQDYFQYGNIFSASIDPISNSKIDYSVTRDGTISDQQSGYLYKKLVYTLDSENRIQLIKEYYTETNRLVSESYYYYP